MSHPKNALPHPPGAKPAAGPRPGAQPRPGVAQPKAAVVAPPARPPVAPPAYRPQPVPRVLQRKAAAGPAPPSGPTARRPVAPPVYRPEPHRVLQPKTMPAQGPKQSAAPPVYRPQPLPRVLQTKSALPPAADARAKHTPAAPPPFTQRRTGPPAAALQPKMAAPRGCAAGGGASRQVIQLTTEVNATAGQTLVKDCYGGKLGGTVFEWDSKFAVDIVDNKVVVTIRIKAAIDPTLFNSIWAKAVEKQWSGRFAVHVAGKSYPIVVQLVQVTSGEHYAVTVSHAETVSGSGSRGHFGTEDMTTWGAHDTFNISHEVGHMLGNVDEYGVVKNRAGKTRDFLAKPSKTIMGVPTNNPVARHYSRIKRAAVREMISLNMISTFDTAKVIPDQQSRHNLNTSLVLPPITNISKLRHVTTDTDSPTITTTSQQPEWMKVKLKPLSSSKPWEVKEMELLLEGARLRAEEHGSGFGKVMVKYIESTMEQERRERESGVTSPSTGYYLRCVEGFVGDLKKLIKEENQQGYPYSPNRAMLEKYPDIFK